ncbi:MULTISPECIES: iron ABC transporter permease [unclassified Paenibacillus]|uniref:FecCD family ABC transporter permease n=1 Tax=unclassified Paenibacillus TaxID=185978 RepID=UPI001AE71FEB|nr:MULTISPECIES: iron ABC transporter permease [unclassified Paenibacillus]MBP1153878.1 iron complex transport system permease protein [Paenibacillus sp. PvP091]MBP1170737.1 iron complex transport system permease protein [Paenibacillus sp. PvR098]MBP2441765.1 iron complex transport system permease protein [Paenibacillus sp. PvP052]
MSGAKSKYVSLRGRAYSFLISKKALAVTFILLLATVAAMILSTGIGSVYITPAEVVRSVFGYGADTSDTIIRSLRLPRVVIAVLIGASLAVSGAILQGVVRNPLASPDTISTTAGATLGAVAFFFFWSEKASIQWLPLSAVVGAFLATLAVYSLSWKNGGVTPLRLVLIGIGFTAAMNALSYMLMISGPIILANKSLTFMTGSIYGVSWEKDVLPLLPWVLILLPLVFVYSRHINIQELGEDVARSVGSAVQRQRMLLMLLSVALAGAAVAFGGAIGFIGLMAPHMARKLVGPAFGALLPVSALIGALILLLADLAGRSLFAPLDIPAGVFTACIGAPFFVYLLYHSRNQG